MNFNAAFHALQNVARSVEQPQTRVDITRSVREFGGQDDKLLCRLGSIAAKVSGAAYGAPFTQHVTLADFQLLKAFVEHAEGDFAMADFTVPDKPDQQHSEDGYSHHLDQEKL